MYYNDGQTIRLGDTVSVPVPDGEALARVVMLGDTQEHLELDSAFLEWVRTTNVLAQGSVVVEWIFGNPFEHQDPNFAPVGNYLFTAIDESVQLKARTAF